MENIFDENRIFGKITAEEKAIKNIRIFLDLVADSAIDLNEFHRLVTNQLNKIDK